MESLDDALRKYDRAGAEDKSHEAPLKKGMNKLLDQLEKLGFNPKDKEAMAKLGAALKLDKAQGLFAALTTARLEATSKLREQVDETEPAKKAAAQAAQDELKRRTNLPQVKELAKALGIHPEMAAEFYDEVMKAPDQAKRAKITAGWLGTLNLKEVRKFRADNHTVSPIRRRTKVGKKHRTRSFRSGTPLLTANGFCSTRNIT